MNRRLLVIIIAATALSFSAGIAVGVIMQSNSAWEVGAPTPAPDTTPDAERRERAEKFFGGDPNRDIRSGQEMRPRW